MMLAHREALTQVAYVNEQYISPRKKSRNSTGYKPAKNSRYYVSLAFETLDSTSVTNLRGHTQATSGFCTRERAMAKG